MIQRITGPDVEPSRLSQWVPMPRYLLRCWIVKRLIRSLEPRDFIEIGAASGEMAEWMSERRQMPGTAVEISPSALQMMHERLDGNKRVKIFDRDSRELFADEAAIAMAASKLGITVPTALSVAIFDRLVFSLTVVATAQLLAAFVIRRHYPLRTESSPAS